MKLFTYFLTATILILSLGTQAASKKNKKNTSAKKVSYQQAKRICLNKDPNFSKEDLKFCIKEQRINKTKVR